jgi:hypothetical protein
VQAGQHRAPDVVQNGGQRQFVPVAVADDLGDSVGRPLHSQGVHPEAVDAGRARVAAEHVVRGGRAQNRLDGTGAKPLDRVGTLRIRPPPWSWPAARTIAQVSPTSVSAAAATS